MAKFVRLFIQNLCQKTFQSVAFLNGATTRFACLEKLSSSFAICANPLHP